MYMDGVMEQSWLLTPDCIIWIQIYNLLHEIKINYVHKRLQESYGWLKTTQIQKYINLNVRWYIHDTYIGGMISSDQCREVMKQRWCLNSKRQCKSNNNAHMTTSYALAPLPLQYIPSRPPLLGFTSPPPLQE